jgi:hypothetical protein
MSTPISIAKQTQPTESATQAPAANQKASVSKTQQIPTDTVTISNSAKVILQEVQENHVQTVQEANGGDSQARRLLAKEAAASITPKG